MKINNSTILIFREVDKKLSILKFAYNLKFKLGLIFLSKETKKILKSIVNAILLQIIIFRKLILIMLIDRKIIYQQKYNKTFCICENKKIIIYFHRFHSADTTFYSI